jgi:hypothetical protein
MAEQDTAPRLTMVCGTCGSDEVTRDAWAEWSVEAQGWALGAVFEQAFCHRCQRAARIVEAPLPAPGAEPGRTDP